MAEVHLQLLADFCLTYAGKPVTAIDTPRLRALAAYLALHRHAPQPRQHLAFRFWPDSSEAQALTNLRKQLLYLRSALPDADQFLDIARQTIQWRASREFRFDVDQFESVLSQAVATTDEQAIHLLRRAINLYRGDLLPECYDDWIFPIRETLRAQYRRALERLVALLEDQRSYPTAIDYTQQLLRHDPLHEPTCRRLMRLYALNDDRAMALRIYHTCVTQLREELGVDPGAETQAAYEQLLNHQPVAENNPLTEPAVPFVGRQAEWQVLQQSWRKSMRGQAHFVLIAGEAGIGKTRLAEELLDWARHQGIATARTRSYAAEGRLAYAPIVEWLRTDLLFPHLQRLDTVWLTELGRLLPEIFTAYPHVPRPNALTISWQRGQLFEALACAFHIAQRPLVLLIDDLQWCDQETLEWLHFLMRFNANGNSAHLLILGTARLPDEVDVRHPLRALLHELQQTGQLTSLDLQRLTSIETTDLANRMSRQSLDKAAIVQLYADTEGNPLFVVETMRANLHGQPQVTTARQSAAMPTAGPSHALASPILPSKVYSVIQARLAQLSPAAQEVAEVAAVIGRQFTLDVLLTAAGKTEEVVVAALDELWLRRIVREQGVQAYDFSHDKIREVVYAESRLARRRLLHRCVAEALELVYPQPHEAIVAQLAFHFEQAGHIEQASVYYLQAGQTAQRVFAYREALEHLKRATTLLEALPPTSARDKKQLDILVAMVIPLLVLSAYTSEQLYNVHERILKLSEKLGQPPYPPVLRALAVQYLLRYRNFTQVQAWGEQILAMAYQASPAFDPILYVEANYVLGVNAFWQGHFAEAKLILQRAIDAYSVERHHRHALLYGQDPGVYCMARLGWDLWYLGYPDQARHLCNLALTLAQRLDHPWSLQMVLIFVNWLYCDCRDVDNVAANYQALQAAHDVLHVESIARYQMFEGWCQVQSAKRQAGIARLYDDIAAWQATNSSALYSPYIYTVITKAYCLEGSYAEAMTAIEEAFVQLKGSQNYWYLAEMYRCKGEVLAGLHQNTNDSEACFQQALKIARQQQAKSLELRAAMSLSRLWAEQGKQSEARQILEPIFHWFTEGFDTPDLIEAKALLNIYSLETRQQLLNSP